MFRDTLGSGRIRSVRGRVKAGYTRGLEFATVQSSNNPPEVLAIMHVEGSVPLRFALTRLPDGKSFVSCSHFFPLRMCRGRPAQLQSHARAALVSGGLSRLPLPETVHADKVLDALKAWGSQAFNALFDRRDAGEWLSKQVCFKSAATIRSSYRGHGKRSLIAFLPRCPRASEIFPLEHHAPFFFSELSKLSPRSKSDAPVPQADNAALRETASATNFNAALANQMHDELWRGFYERPMV